MQLCFPSRVSVRPPKPESLLSAPFLSPSLSPRYAHVSEAACEVFLRMDRREAPVLGCLVIDLLGAMHAASPVSQTRQLFFRARTEVLPSLQVRRSPTEQLEVRQEGRWRLRAGRRRREFFLSPQHLGMGPICVFHCELILFPGISVYWQRLRKAREAFRVSEGWGRCPRLRVLPGSCRTGWNQRAGSGTKGTGQACAAVSRGVLQGAPGRSAASGAAMEAVGPSASHSPSSSFAPRPAFQLSWVSWKPGPRLMPEEQTPPSQERGRQRWQRGSGPAGGPRGIAPLHPAPRSLTPSFRGGFFLNRWPCAPHRNVPKTHTSLVTRYDQDSGKQLKRKE